MVERTSGWINVAVWAIASGVMIYGAVNVTPLLIEHGVLRWTAPGLPLMVDLAMCIGLWGDRIMHQYGRTASWVTALRWITAAMTLLLNVSGPVLVSDWVGLGIHASGPLLILVVAEAAGAFQRTFAEIVAELYAEIDRQRTEPSSAHAAVGDSAVGETDTGAATPSRSAVGVRTGWPGDPRDRGIAASVSDSSCLAGDVTPGVTFGLPVGSLPPIADLGSHPPHGGREVTVENRPSADGAAGQPRRERRRDRDADDEHARRERDTTVSRRAARRDGPGQLDVSTENETPLETADARSPARDIQDRMWSSFQRLRAEGVRVTGAELDREAGTNNYGRKVIQDWLRTGRITEQELADARRGNASSTAAAAQSGLVDLNGQREVDESPLEVSITNAAEVGASE